MRNGLLCEGRLVEEAQAFDGYAFPREMTRAVVYQEAGATRQPLVQRPVSQSWKQRPSMTRVRRLAFLIPLSSTGTHLQKPEKGRDDRL